MSVPSMSRTAMVGSFTPGRYPASPSLTALFHPGALEPPPDHRRTASRESGVRAEARPCFRPLAALSAGQAAQCLGNGRGAVLVGDPGSEVTCPVQVGRAGSGVAKCDGEGGNGEPPKRDRPGPDPEGGGPRGPEWLITDHRHADGGNAGAQSCRRGASASVVNDGGHSREEPVMRRVTDQD